MIRCLKMEAGNLSSFFITLRGAENLSCGRVCEYETFYFSSDLNL